MSNDTLLLNANGAPLSVTPLSTLSWQESIKLIWLDKINVLEWANKNINPRIDYSNFIKCWLFLF